MTSLQAFALAAITSFLLLLSVCGLPQPAAAQTVTPHNAAKYGLLYGQADVLVAAASELNEKGYLTPTQRTALVQLFTAIYKDFDSARASAVAGKDDTFNAALADALDKEADAYAVLAAASDEGPKQTS